MKRTELCLELRRDKNFLKFRQLRPGNKFFTLGSSRDADLRLLGKDVNGIHAIIEYKRDAWFIYDLGGQVGTTVNNEKIVEYKIEKPVEVRIGDNVLNVVHREINKELFQKEDRDIKGTSSEKMGHQVVVRLKGHVIESKMLDRDEPYEFQYGLKNCKLNPPKTKQWVWEQFDNLMVQQRLIAINQKNYSVGLSLGTFLPRDLRKPMGAAIMGFVLIVTLLTMPYIGQEKKTVMPESNPYSAMIYDAKIVKKKVEKSQKVASQILNRGKPMGPNPDPNAKVEVLSPNPSNVQTKDSSFDAPPAGGGPKLAGKKAIQQIRAGGLSALVGRISKRVSTGSSNVIKVANTDNSNIQGGMPSIRDIAALGAKIGKLAPGTGGSGGDGTGGSGTQRLAGIGTIGTGGANSYREFGKMTPGSVGTAEVGALEEEADIEGGLDREVIAQFIQSEIGHIRYCYERQLSANPELYGKIKIQFMIGGGGKVVHQKVSSTTLNNAIVEGCILKRVSGWTFPTPKGGSTVLVSYPFLFKSTN